MGDSLEIQFSRLTPAQQQEFLAGLDPHTLTLIARGEWFWVSRPEQVPPAGDWNVYLALAGRGWGKTRAGAEWIVDRTVKHPFDSSGFPTERLVMGNSLSDARAVCIEGASGVLRVLQRLGFEEHKSNRILTTTADNKYSYTKSPKPHIVLMGTETKIHFTGSDPDAARGYNLADAWLDEPVKYDDPWATWQEGVSPALRADIPGDKPRTFVTTTPKPTKLLQYWVKHQVERKILLVRGSTFDNAANLSPESLEELRAAYEGTALGAQELYGELLDDVQGALFGYRSIEDHRVDIGPERVAHRTVAVDPGLTGEEDGDEMGVIVAVRSADDHIYIVADRTIKASGRDAALYAWRIFEEYGADTLVVEENLAKAWMRQVLVDAFRELQRAGVFPAEIVEPPLVPVFSVQGKKLRAEPVAMRYQQGRVHHIGRFEKLEAQMLTFDPLSSKTSPDRLDALVHACRHLMDGEKRRSFVISPTQHRIQALDRWDW